MPTSFSEVLSRLPLRPFSVLTFGICMFVLIADGMDQQLLGIVAPGRGVTGMVMWHSRWPWQWRRAWPKSKSDSP